MEEADWTGGLFAPVRPPTFWVSQASQLFGPVSGPPFLVQSDSIIYCETGNSQMIRNVDGNVGK